MRIKKQFLNEESLKSYGFIKKVLYGDERYCEYWNHEDSSDVFIQRVNGDIAMAIDTDICDCDNIPDVIYHLIKDGLVEINEEETK